VRHGETDWNTNGRIQGREEIPLNETGISQAEKCADGFFEAMEKAGILWDRVLTSPLVRASKTAKIIADKINCNKISSDERLIERNYGVISGYTYKEYERAIYNDVQNIEGLESKDEIIERLNDFMRGEIKVGERAVLVSHGGISRVYALQAEKCEKLTNDDVVRMENCHINVYTYDGKNIVLEGYNIAPCDFYKFVAENTK
jgi:broad specificity phosphatase PhoE